MMASRDPLRDDRSTRRIAVLAIALGLLLMLGAMLAVAAEVAPPAPPVPDAAADNPFALPPYGDIRLLSG